MVRYSFLVRLSHPLLHAGLIPALSLITLSARARNSGESVSPICLAVFKLITNSDIIRTYAKKLKQFRDLRKHTLLSIKRSFRPGESLPLCCPLSRPLLSRGEHPSCQPIQGPGQSARGRRSHDEQQTKRGGETHLTFKPSGGATQQRLMHQVNAV